MDSRYVEAFLRVQLAAVDVLIVFTLPYMELDAKASFVTVGETVERPYNPIHWR